MNEPSQPPKFTIKLEYYVPYTLPVFLIAFPVGLFAAWACYYMYCVPTANFPNEYKYGATIAVIVAAVVTFIAGFLTYDGFWTGNTIVFDEEGVYQHFPFGKVRHASWKEMTVDIPRRQVAVEKENNADWMRLFGPLGKLAAQSFAEYDHQTILGMHFKSPTLNAKIEPGNAYVVAASCWMTCRDLQAELARIGGKATWDAIGFTSLDLAFTAIVDDDFITVCEMLRRVPQLTRLNLSHTPLSNAVVPHLAALPSLKEVDITASGITPDQLPLILHQPSDQPAK